MQKAYINTLYELAKSDSRVVSVLTDSGTEYDEMFAREFPKQCVNFGIAEENMMAAAAGMANCGMIPFVYTSGAFLAYRAFEFLRNDVCLQRNNVKVIGMGSGLSWSTLGPTHHTTEDIGVLRTIPGLTILSASSPNEVKKMIEAAYKIDGPVYVRLGMKGEREIYDDGFEYVVGKNIIVKNGTKAAVFTTGSIIGEVLDAADELAAEGVDITVVDVHTIKPFDEKSTKEVIERHKIIVCVEEHNVFGGLGSIVADTIVQEERTVTFCKIGLNDRFATGYGTQEQVRKANGLDAGAIYKRLKELIVGEEKRV